MFVSIWGKKKEEDDRNEKLSERHVKMTLLHVRTYANSTFSHFLCMEVS